MVALQANLHLQCWNLGLRYSKDQWLSTFINTGFLGLLSLGRVWKLGPHIYTYVVSLKEFLHLLEGERERENESR